MKDKKKTKKKNKTTKTQQQENKQTKYFNCMNERLWGVVVVL
jgi:hypothetical protein